MRVGTIRPEEAKVFDSEAGEFTRADGKKCEVYWKDHGVPGWYWTTEDFQEGDGPFARSSQAKEDAQP